MLLFGVSTIIIYTAIEMKTCFNVGACKQLFMFVNDIFPGAGLEIRRKILTIPLVWCWRPKSNLDLTESSGLLAVSIRLQGVFAFLPSPAKARSN